MSIDFNTLMTLLWRTWHTNPLWLQPYVPCDELSTLFQHICFPMKPPLPHTHTHTNWTHALPYGKSATTVPGVTNNHILPRCSQLCSISWTKVCNVITVEERGSKCKLCTGVRGCSRLFSLVQLWEQRRSSGTKWIQHDSYYYWKSSSKWHPVYPFLLDLWKTLCK